MERESETTPAAAADTGLTQGDMNSGFVCIGDYIGLFCEDTDGHVFSQNSCAAFNGLFVYHNSDRDRPTNVPDPQVLLFQVCIQNRYKLDKKYRKISSSEPAGPRQPQQQQQQQPQQLDSGEASPLTQPEAEQQQQQPQQQQQQTAETDFDTRLHLEQARNAAAAENVDNMAEQRRNLGKRVRYGEIIQLKHIFTDKFIHVNTNHTSQQDKNNMLLSLHEYNSKNAQFRILPRYKVKSEGEFVQLLDQISLESIKSPGHYFHASQGFNTGPESRRYFVSELNLGVEQTGFTIIKSHGCSEQPEAYARGGQFVQLFHKELEAYVVAEGLFDQDVTEDVHLRIREIDQLNPRTLHSSTSAVTYWQMEPESTVLNGEVLTWDQQFRFRHATTRKYLSVRHASETYSVTLSDDPTDPRTVFKMHPVLQDSPELKFESYARIEHVITGCWLHAIKDKSYQRKEFLNMEDEKSMQALRWDGGELREITCCFDRRYDDAYTIQKVEPEHVMSFNFVAGVVPTLLDLINARQTGKPLSSKETFRICHALRELRGFMLVNGEPCKAKQKLLRNLRVIDLLVMLLKFPLKGAQDEHNLTKVFSEAYDILHTYMMGNSRKNALYFAKYIEFFQTQMVDKSELALKVTKMLVELMKDNRKIVDRISHAQIEVFVELLRRNEHHSYLELLKVLCVCNGVAITENQNFIAQKWLLEDTRGVCMTNRGQNIDRKPNETYVSCDQQRSWQPLLDFVQPDECDTEGIERCFFLRTQLDLFIALCHGRNEDCIRLITKDLSYLTWEEAYLGLSSESLPHEFRAKYCEIVIGLFVNVGNNYSVVESPQLCFIYEYVGTKDFGLQASSAEHYQQHGRKVEGPTRQESRAAKDLITIFPVIRDWIAEFLDQNRMMVASQIANNILIEQVLKLLHYLVKFGYYGDVHDLARLLPSLRNLLDGQNDIPFPYDRLPVREFSKERKKVVQRFKQTERFRRSPETQAIVRAKHAALQVLDLVMTFQENARLASFIKKFKDCEMSEGATRRKNVHPLVPALYDSFDPFDTRKSALQLQKKMKKELRIMFEESSRYVDSVALTSILIDLAHYEYDPMVQLSLQLLNKLHSAKSSMFNLAVSSLVLITPDSCRVHREVGKQVPLLKMMVRSKWTSDQAMKIENILSELSELCHLPKAEEEPHPMNQRLMLSHNVLGVVFDILSTETDVQLTEKYHETVGVLRKAVRLMKALTMRYEDVQNQVFNNLDNLLRVRLVEPDLALALKEVFVNNQELCLKILPKQISRIVGLVAENQERAPEFLELLSAIVKVEGPGLALKRNQTLVMKYIMQNYSKVGYVLEQCTTRDRMDVLNGNRGASHCQYLISLVDLLATCAEGENRYIESLCQTIISVEEILSILNDPNVENHLKKPFLRYMFFAYMKTSGSTAENRSPDIIQDRYQRLIWEYVKHLTLEFEGLTRWIRNDASRDTVYFMSMRLFPKIMRLHDTCPLCSSLVAEDESKPLKLNLENAVVKMREDDFRGHASLHYVFDAVLPFLQAFAGKFYQTEEDKDSHSERELFDRLTLATVGLCSELASIVVEPRILTQMVTCLSTLVRRSSHRPAVMEPVVENIGKGTKLQDTVSQMKSGNKEYYEQEITLNSKLKTLALNMSMLWGGQNTVRAQLKYNSDREYTVIGGDEVLPLDEEFQEHVRCFINAASRKPEARYRLAGLLVNGLRITSVSSAAGATRSPSSSASEAGPGGHGESERLAIRILQILRAFIHNEERRLPEDWEVRMSELRVKRGLRNIAEIQNTLNSFDLMKHALPHLASTSGLVAKEVLSLLAIMLFNANEKVQESMLKYFLHTKEEVFFFAVRNRLQMSTANIKEKRLLISQQRARQMDACSQADNLRTTMTLGVKALQQIQQYHIEMKIDQANSDLTRRVSLTQMQSASITKKKKNGNGRSDNDGVHGNKNSTVSKGPVGADLGRRVALANGVARGEKDASSGLLKGGEDVGRDDRDHTDGYEQELEKISMKDDGYIGLVLKVLARICDGQHKGLQNYLREQPDNIKSFNLVAEVSQFINVAYSNINSDTIELLIQLFSSVNEFCAGNQENRATVYDNKIIDYINFILRTSDFDNCELEQILSMRQAIANLLMSLIEENSPEAVVIGREVKDTLDKEALYRVMTECYEYYQRDNSGKDGWLRRLMKNDDNKELREAIFDVGFSFYTILARLYDIDPTMGKKELRVTDLQLKAFKFFKKNSMTIEMLKDSNLQKIHFRVRNKNVLREEVKEKLKWNVDRNSSSTKIRDFMDWTKAILNDIHYQKKVLSNPLTIVLTRFWLIWNHAATLVAVILNLIMLIGLEAPPGGANTPTFDISSDASLMPPQAFFNTTGQWKADYPTLPTWLYAFAYILDALSIVILLAFFVANHPRPPDVGRLIRRLRRLRRKELDEDEDLREAGGQDKLSVRLLSIATLYYLVFIGCAFAGTFYSPYFFAFHLLNIVNNNQMLRGVIQAVTTNGLSLVWVSVLGIAIMYLYAVVAFAKFRIAFRPDDSLMFCGTLYQCFVTILRYGLIGDLFENLIPPTTHRTFDEYIWMALFSVTFFIIITTIGLNIIFGIIVDTFSQLRDKKWLAETDMRNCCFICSRNNYDFEHHGQGFEHHVRSEHNMWAYIFFFIHLEDTAKNDYTSLDLHVYKMLKEERFDFFPLNRALCLSARDDDSTESKIDELLNNVKDLVQHQKEEETERRRWVELNRQKKWQQKVLSSGHQQQESAAAAAAVVGGVGLRGSQPNAARSYFLNVPRRPHEEGDDDDEDDELRRSSSLPGSEDDYRLSVPNVNQPHQPAAGPVEDAAATDEHMGFLDDYDENGEPRPQ